MHRLGTVLGLTLALLIPLAPAPGSTATSTTTSTTTSTVTSTATGASTTREPARPGPAPGERPNIVVVQMDDFSTELLTTMSQAERMRATGASFRHSYVVDSLCCPSRASFFTGQAPHHTGVLTNTPNDAERPIGGWEAFRANGNVERSVAVALQAAGYTTGFTGKYVNGYEPTTGPDDVPVAPVAGWSEFMPLFGGAYNGWGYRAGRRNEAGELELTVHPPPPASSPAEVKDAAYMETLTASNALDFIERHEAGEAPYFLQVSTYGPHGRLGNPYRDNYVFPPAFADRPGPGEPRGTGGNCGLRACGDLGVADLVGWDDDRTDNAPTYLRGSGGGARTEPAPAWRDNPITMTRAAAERHLRDRARMVQSIDRMLRRILDTVGEDTYVVLTADNGFHLGQHQLNGGKGTPYDSDARVPMLVVGPGVVPGPRQQVVSNLDVAPTLERLAGLPPAPFRDGSSFDRVLSDPSAPGGRRAFYEHTYALVQPGEVDADRGAGGTIDIIPSYVAVRSPRGLLVRFDLDDSWEGEDFAWELYDGAQGFEATNDFAELHREPWVRDLQRRLERWAADGGCSPGQCRALAR